MAHEIRIEIEGGFIRVVYRGDVEYSAINDMLRQVGVLAGQNGISRILFDIRGANYQFYHAGPVRHALEAPALGIHYSFRIAFLGAGDNSMLRYIEAVSVNRGYWVKAFTEEAPALHWLLAED